MKSSQLAPDLKGIYIDTRPPSLGGPDPQSLFETYKKYNVFMYDGKLVGVDKNIDFSDVQLRLSWASFTKALGIRSS